MCKANWVLGDWSARNLGKKAFVASSFYESGYDALYAYNLGYEKAGGQIVQTRVSNLPTDGKDFDSLIQSIKKCKPDLVFAAYSGEEAAEFVQAYHQAELDHRIPLLGSAFMVDETQLPRLGSGALGIKSCFPWSASLNQQVNRDFYTAYKKNYGTAPDSFAVLGYETAQLIAYAINKIQGDLSKTNGLRNNLIKAKINSPRGELQQDATTHSISSPLYLREVHTNGNGLKNEVFDTIRSIDNQNLIACDSDSEIRTGWLNPYLCA
jgi:branched-chain amino acid transport system substrate-binding protein